MNKYIPIEKRSKKERRLLAAKQRGSWNGINPVTRKPQNSKAYNRAKARKWSDKFHDRAFYIVGLEPTCVALRGHQSNCPQSL